MEKMNLNAKFDFLEKIGFGNVPDCDPSIAFRTKTVAINSQIVVRGDHSDDLAYIYYTCIEKDDEVLDGLFYAPSLLEHPLLNSLHFNLNELLEEINYNISAEARYV